MKKAEKQAKIDKLKKEGKWMSKAERAKKEAAQERRQAMIEAGLVPNIPRESGEHENDEEAVPQKRSVVVRRERKKKDAAKADDLKADDN